MNNMPYPYMPVPMPFPAPSQDNYNDELNKLKYEIAKIKERLSELEKKNNKNYLKKEDGFYMM